jgi:DNA-binding XRE family transcriptional regulator
VRTRPFREFAADVVATPEGRARVDEYKRVITDALALAALRAVRGVSQRQVAGALGVSQANVSRIEHEEDVYLSTLRRYVAALGGELEVSAVFPDERVTLIAARS